MNNDTWIKLEGNEKEFDNASINNCECFFADGTVFDFNSIDTDAELTHFRDGQFLQCNGAIS